MLSDEETTRTLASAVREIEAHAAESGWDQSAVLFALVPTAELVVAEPALADALGLDRRLHAGYTPIDQELPADAVLEDALESITWPDGVAGCAAVVERLVLPPSADERHSRRPRGGGVVRRGAPRAPGAAHGGRRRCVTGRRTAPTVSAVTTTPRQVVTGPDLVPALLELLQATLV